MRCLPGHDLAIPDVQENALLGRIEDQVEALLARTFESYYSLKDDTPTGILEGGEPAPEQPAPALVPAVQLAGKPMRACSSLRGSAIW